MLILFPGQEYHVTSILIINTIKTRAEDCSHEAWDANGLVVVEVVMPHQIGNLCNNLLSSFVLNE